MALEQLGARMKVAQELMRHAESGIFPLKYPPSAASYISPRLNWCDRTRHHRIMEEQPTTRLESSDRWVAMNAEIRLADTVPELRWLTLSSVARLEAEGFLCRPAEASGTEFSQLWTAASFLRSWALGTFLRLGI